jgi:predicted phage terminase large subunit-like protein
MTMARQWWDVVADDFDPAVRLRDDDPTPGALARRLERSTVQTPALGLIDDELVAIRDHIGVMMRRRERLVELVGADEENGDSDALATAIELVEAEIPDAGNARLIVSAPPQEGKSQRITRYGLLWLLRQFPTLRIGIVSFDGDAAATWSWQIRGDIELYDGVSNPIDLGLRLVPGQKAMSRWVLQTGGGVFAIGIGGGLTSRPLDMLVIDDPVKDIRAADSLIQSAAAWDWWFSVARPRLAPWAPVIEVATRWHEADLGGRLQAKQLEDEAAGERHFDRWRVLNIPAEADHDPNAGETDVLGRPPGEFMVSARGRTLTQWLATKSATPARFWTALYQGRPSPETGAIWLKEWWRRYEVPIWTQHPDGTFRLDGYDVAQSWDCAFRDTKSSDYVVGQVWAKRGADSYLVYQVHRRLSFTETLDAVRHTKWLFPQTRKIIIEGKANGDAVVDSLKHEIPGIVVFEPGRDSKEGRATAVSPFIRAGNVHLPTTRVASMSPEISFDVEAFILEATAFPNAAHDDQVDAASQYIFEAHRVSGESSILVATGRIPLSSVKRQGQQTLSPFQRRFVDRQLRR